MARLVAVYGRGGPARSARRGNTFGIQVARDLARGPARDILAEDPPDDLGLALDDLQLARLARYRTVAIGTPPGMAPVAHDPIHPPPHLVGEIGEVERAQEAAHPDLDLIGGAFMHRAQFDPGEVQTLPDAGKVFLIT